MSDDAAMDCLLFLIQVMGLIPGLKAKPRGNVTVARLVRIHIGYQPHLGMVRYPHCPMVNEL